MKKTFDEELYKKIAINDLIIFCIYFIIGKGEKCTFERLIKECFFLFPKVFSFTHIPQWPDSRKIDRPLRYLREEKVINEIKGVFSLTKIGEKRAQDLVKVFKQGKLI